jgi:hypothetical protein
MENRLHREEGLAAYTTTTTHLGCWAHHGTSFDHHHTTKNGRPAELL